MIRGVSSDRRRPRSYQSTVSSAGLLSHTKPPLLPKSSRTTVSSMKTLPRCPPTKASPLATPAMVPSMTSAVFAPLFRSPEQPRSERRHNQVNRHNRNRMAAKPIDG